MAISLGCVPRGFAPARRNSPRRLESTAGGAFLKITGHMFCFWVAELARHDLRYRMTHQCSLRSLSLRGLGCPAGRWLKAAFSLADLRVSASCGGFRWRLAQFRGVFPLASKRSAEIVSPVPMPLKTCDHHSAPRLPLVCVVSPSLSLFFRQLGKRPSNRRRKSSSVPP